MVVLNKEEFERLLRIVSKREYVQEDPILNEIVKYKSALRSLAARKIVNELIVEERTEGIENFIDDLFNLDFCATQAIDEISLDYPPNVIRILDALEASALKSKSIDDAEYFVDLILKISSEPATLYYKKFVGDLYMQLKIKYLVGKDIKGRVYEEALKSSVEENGGIIVFEQNVKRYLSEIRRDYSEELRDKYSSKLSQLFSPAESSKEFVMQQIIEAEIDWHKRVCDR